MSSRFKKQRPMRHHSVYAKLTIHLFTTSKLRRDTIPSTISAYSLLRRYQQNWHSRTTPSEYAADYPPCNYKGSPACRLRRAHDRLNFSIHTQRAPRRGVQQTPEYGEVDSLPDDKSCRNIQRLPVREYAP